MTKLRILFCIIAAALIGAGVTLASAGLLLPSAPESSPFLRNLSVEDLARQTNTGEWQILKDQTDSSAIQSTRISRRIVAKVQVAPRDVQLLARNIDSAFEKNFTRHGAIQTGEASFSESSVHLTNDEKVFTDFSSPRYYYRSGKVNGMADVTVVGTGSGAVVLISISE